MITGIIFGLASAIFSALSAVLQKKVLLKFKVVSFSLTVNFLILFYTLIFYPISNFDLSPYNNFLLIIKSLLINIAFYYVMRSIQTLNLSEALPLLAMSPLPISLFAALILNEYLNFVQILALVSILAGVYLIELPNSNNIFAPFRLLLQKKYFTVLLALIIFIITSLIDRYLLNKQNFPINQLLLYQHIVGTVFFAVLFILNKEFSSYTKDIKPIFWIILLISIFTIAYRIFEFLSIKNIPVAIAIATKRISVLLAVIIGGQYFKEIHLKYRIPATVLILAGITIFLLN